MVTIIVNKDECINKGSMGRHETFTPRYGWLKKGYEASKEEFDVFKAKDAIERLGVGKNMVSSIKFWTQAFKLIEPVNGKMGPTQLGEAMLDEEGWDPYLEDVASLWLLHWHLFIPKLDAVNWSLAFNKCNLFSFDNKLLSQVLKQASQKYSRLGSMSDNTFNRDASCIIRMYAPESADKVTEIECPFTQMGLLLRAEEKNLVYFNTTEKRSLPPLIFAAACFSYMHNYFPGQRTITLQKLAYDFNSPGVAFKLPETVVGRNLQSALFYIDGVSIEDLEGTLQLHLGDDPQELFWKALRTYYT